MYTLFDQEWEAPEQMCFYKLIKSDFDSEKYYHACNSNSQHVIFRKQIDQIVCISKRS